MSDYSQVQLSPKQKRTKLERWQRIAREAARQSENLFLPHIEIGEDATTIFESEQADTKVILWARGESNVSTTNAESYAIAIGPEGGFSERELACGRKLGWSLLTLPTPVLRVEHAAPCAYSYLLGQLSAN